jgi:phosphate transport system substrate-binding protein
MKNQKLKLIGTACAALILCVAQFGCKKSEAGGQGGASGGSSGSKTTLQIQGSDTMVNLAQAWAEAYHKINPNVGIEVGGGGSGVGIAALINGTIEVATSSRDMKKEERTKAQQQSGKEAKEFTVGFDCLAIYVHKDNPLTEISLEQLAAIYAEGGNTAKWTDLNANVPGCASGEIIRVSRQSSSGTYEFFREHVLNKKDFKLNSRDMNGSKEVVDLVMHTPCAIGYSGMGYATPEVKMLKVASKAGAPAQSPSIEAAQNKTYPISRPLFLYTLGEPQGAAKEFIQWVMSDAGQKIVQETGYVPVPKQQQAKLN